MERRPLATDRSRGLSEKNSLRFLRDRRLRVDFFRFGIGTRDRRLRLDPFKPSLQIRKALQLLSLALVGYNPWVTRHVGDGIHASDEIAIGQALIEDTIEA